MLQLSRIVIGVLSTIVLMTPTPAKAGWELIGGSDKKMYFDPDTIVKKGNVTRYWSAITFTNPEKGISTIQMYNSMDCHTDILSTDRMIGYELEGNIIADQKTSSVQPRFYAVLMQEFVCSK